MEKQVGFPLAERKKTELTQSLATWKAFPLRHQTQEILNPKKKTKSLK
jgi:hypothetical protein